MTKDEASEIFDFARMWASAAVRYSGAPQQEQEFIALLNSMAEEPIDRVTDQKNLRGFVREIMENWPLSDIDGKLQDLAIKYGLIKLRDPPPSEPCREECTCVDYFDLQEFVDGKVECYERTNLLLGL